MFPCLENHMRGTWRIVFILSELLKSVCVRSAYTCQRLLQQTSPLKLPGQVQLNSYRKVPCMTLCIKTTRSHDWTTKLLTYCFAVSYYSLKLTCQIQWNSTGGFLVWRVREKQQGVVIKQQQHQQNGRLVLLLTNIPWKSQVNNNLNNIKIADILFCFK